MGTRLYLTRGPISGITSGSKSAVLPVGTDFGNSFSTTSLMTTRKGTGETTATTTTLTSGGHQDGRVARWAFPLSAQTIAGGTWTFGAKVSEQDINANAYYALSLYVWRPSTSSVVGYIADLDGPLGAEWPTTAAGRLCQFTGQAVQVETGDLLVLEVWVHAENPFSSHLLILYYGGTTDVTENSTASAASFLEAPVVLHTKPEVLYVKGVTASGSFGGSSFAVNLSAALQESQLVLCLAHYPNVTTSVSATEWQLLAMYESSDLVLKYYDAVSSASFNGNTTVQTSSGDAGIVAAIAAEYTHQDVDVGVAAYAGGPMTGGIGTAIIAPSVDAPISGGMHLAVLAWTNLDTGTPNTTSSPTGYERRLYVTASTRWAVLSLDDKVVGPGPTGDAVGNAAISVPAARRIGLSILIASIPPPPGMGGGWGILLS